MKKYIKSKLCPWHQEKEVQKEIEEAEKKGVRVSHGICDDCAEKFFDVKK